MPIKKIGAHPLYFLEFKAEQNRILRLLKGIVKVADFYHTRQDLSARATRVPQVPKLVFFPFPLLLLVVLRDTAEVLGAAIESLSFSSEPGLDSTIEPVRQGSEGGAEPFHPGI